MSAAITLKNFAELADYIDVAKLPPGPGDEPSEPLALNVSHPGADTRDLDALLVELASASALLASVAQSDAQVRSVAVQDLERYDTLLSQASDANSVWERAEQVRHEAEAFLACAFGDEARDAAERVVRLAIDAAATARELVQSHHRAADRLANRSDIQRLLEERRREAALEEARAAEAARAQQRSEVLARVAEALQADLLAEARRLLVPLIESEPEHPDVMAMRRRLAQRAFVLRALAAETALRTVRRREVRDDPSQAVALLVALDVNDLPEPLGRQVFGAWATACRQLCEQRELLEPLRYAPDPGRGVVLARERPGGLYVVVSALGMSLEWRPGRVLRDDSRRDQQIVRRARPLR
jgi:hypothetical protein